MLKEVEEYFEVKQAVEAAHTERVEEAVTALNGATGDYRAQDKARTAYYARVSASEALRDTELKAAWLRLGLATEDPLARYIVTRVQEHQRDEGEKVLRHLPATVMQLREIAARGDWCGEFNNHLTTARREGFIEDDRDPAEAALEDWVESNVSNRHVPELLKLIDAAVKARVAATLAEIPAVEAAPVEAAPEGEREAQLARVDAVWASVAATAPATISVADAEFVFRQAMRAVITGQGEMFADEVAETLTPNHEVQLGRLDAVWSQAATLASPTIARDAAEHLFRQAAQAVVTGESEMFDASGAAHPDAEAAEDSEPVF